MTMPQHLSGATALFLSSLCKFLGLCLRVLEEILVLFLFLLGDSYNRTVGITVDEGLEFLGAVVDFDPFPVIAAGE